MKSKNRQTIIQKLKNINNVDENSDQADQTNLPPLDEYQSELTDQTDQIVTASDKIGMVMGATDETDDTGIIKVRQQGIIMSRSPAARKNAGNMQERRQMTLIQPIRKVSDKNQ